MTRQQSQRARLAVLVSSDRRRGAEVFAEALTAGLTDRGWEVRLFALSAAATGPRVTATALSTIPPDRLGKLDRKVLVAIRREVRKWRPQIVLANGAATLQYTVAGLRVMPHRPRLVYVSIGEPTFWIRNARHRLVRNAILKGVDRVLSVSSTTATQLVDSLGVPPAKVRVAPTGVPDRFFAVTRGSPGDELRVVFIGNLSSEKDPLAALEVVRRAAHTHPVRLRMLGGGPLRERLDDEVVGSGLVGTVELLGPVPDIVPHLAWADVLLLTSRTEGLPAVPLEAGAAGVSSVVFDVGGAAETVLDGETGTVVPPGDLRLAAAALTELAADPELRRRRGEAARRFVRERFTLDAAVARYADLLADELGRSPSRAAEPA